MKATKILGQLKKKAVDEPGMLPAQVLKELNVENVAMEVTKNLPDVINIRQALLRAKAKELPANPTNIHELEYIPRRFSVTKSGHLFLLYDSNSDDDYNLECGRIIIFASENNLRQLFCCKIWFADETFKTVPAIFYELFTVMDQFSYIWGDKEKTAADPLVYALLETKQEAAYHKVFEVIMSEVRQLQISVQILEKVISDFELAMINAVEKHLEKIVAACWFNLRQSVHRQIQSNGLQRAYVEEANSSVRDDAHMLCALAFVPVECFCRAFLQLKRNVPKYFKPIMDYFEVLGSSCY